MAREFQRTHVEVLQKRLREKRKFIQVLAGPRQSGKTTIVQQTMDLVDFPAHYITADELTVHTAAWLQQQWEHARLLAEKNKTALLVIDEIQKIAQWHEAVKRLWDEDTRKKLALHVVLSGSAPLLIQKGISESLAGRFELIPVTHWSFPEMQKAFGWNVQQYIYFGGYPGSAHLVDNEIRWKSYIKDSLIETTVSRDVLLLNRVDKPALLRQLFHLGCLYSGQIVSYQKLVGQLQDAGNTTTLAHYLRLLSGSGMLNGLEKFSGRKVKQKSSSPKLLVSNTALLSVFGEHTFKEAQQSGDVWGRLTESSVGAHLLNASAGTSIEVLYWREGHREVDFILRRGKKVAAVEVKSSRIRESLAGMDEFVKQYKPYRILLVGKDGIPVEQFLAEPITTWLA
ncbi:MAG: ATP-binding protein [Bacteroidota bacterium]|nr:ATP-binding protein [Bacteroidota bacterium]